MISTDSVSKLSKATKANENYKLLLTEKDLQLKKCEKRYILCIYTSIILHACTCMHTHNIV